MNLITYFSLGEAPHSCHLIFILIVHYFIYIVVKISMDLGLWLSQLNRLHAKIKALRWQHPITINSWIIRWCPSLVSICKWCYVPLLTWSEQWATWTSRWWWGRGGSGGVPGTESTQDKGKWRETPSLAVGSPSLEKKQIITFKERNDSVPHESEQFGCTENSESKQTHEQWLHISSKTAWIMLLVTDYLMTG